MFFSERHVKTEAQLVKSSKATTETLLRAPLNSSVILINLKSNCLPRQLYRYRRRALQDYAKQQQQNNNNLVHHPVLRLANQVVEGRPYAGYEGNGIQRHNTSDREHSNMASRTDSLILHGEAIHLSSHNHHG